jgi:hypothetical protein
MLAFLPTPLVPSTAFEPVLAEVHLKSDPPTSTGRFRSTIKGSVQAQTIQTVSARAAYLTQSTVQTSRKVQSIPIHPPR